MTQKISWSIFLIINFVAYKNYHPKKNSTLTWQSWLFFFQNFIDFFLRYSLDEKRVQKQKNPKKKTFDTHYQKINKAVCFFSSKIFSNFLWFLFFKFPLINYLSQFSKISVTFQWNLWAKFCYQNFCIFANLQFFSIIRPPT